MTLKADLRQFLDEEGEVLELTEQANKVFKFLIKIVLSVSKNIDLPLIEVDLKCNTRGDDVSCFGKIEARYKNIGLIEWHCDSCDAAGTISNWQASRWDRQKHTIH